MQELFGNGIATISRETGIVRVRRTSAPLALEEITEVVDELVGRFRILVPLRERKSLGLLIDSRDAPMSIDDDSVSPMRPLLEEMMREFGRTAVLVRTAVGKLQASRRVREEANAGRPFVPRVFDDEAAALAFLRGEEPATLPPRSSRSSG